ncbi:MAG: hypothetical protein ACJ8D4_20590 [Xanthobacteraceae bacterium]
MAPPATSQAAPQANLTGQTTGPRTNLTSQTAPQGDVARPNQPTAEKPAAKQRAANTRANKQKRRKRPAPYEMREFLAGHW